MSSSGRIARLFRSRVSRRVAARRRVSGAGPAVEVLEPRAMLAFTSPLPATGTDLLGADIIITSDGTDPTNELIIILDDKTPPPAGSVPGAITATITTTSYDKNNTATTSQTQVYNFGTILYSACDDMDGSVKNSVSLWTSYEADLAGYEIAPSVTATTGLSTKWVVASHFPPGGPTTTLDMFNVDNLTVTCGLIGGNASTIAGEFESPTLPAFLNPNTAAKVTLNSGTGVTGADLGGTTAFEPIVAYSLAVTSQTGNIDFSGAGGGGAVGVAIDHDLTLKATAGSVTLPTTALVAESDISITSYAALTLAAALQSDSGDISLASTHDAVAVNGNLRAAAGRVTLDAIRGITQTGSIIAGELKATNASSTAIVLTNARNDVDYFAASNPAGDVTFADADGFETGVNRTGPLGVEISGVNVTLSSAAPYSTIRVVSGLQYKTLSVGAGPGIGSTVGTVKFVPTSDGDNVPSPAGAVPTFKGTLRDMIRYINDNTAIYSNATTNRSVPMALVFDEAGTTVKGTSYSYDVGTITLGAVVLPTLNRAVSFDGGRLTPAMLGTQTRLNIAQGTTALPYGLSFASAMAAVPGRTPAYPGSAGSSIQHVAAYGFTTGSALVLGSSNNTVTDFYAGLDASGAFKAANFVGLDITGTTATGNQIGSAVFDPATANRFGGNTSAGILIRKGASGNKVYGSVIGGDTVTTPSLANGDGIRITGATGNLIGTPDEVQPDQTTSVSNVIAGNTGNGVVITNSIAGTAAAGNVLRNNFVSGNKVGVAVTASKFQTLGGSDGRSANVIVSQTADGVAIANSTDVQLLGNSIGVNAGVAAGNGLNGVSITGTSQRVQITSGNRIAANAFNGVAINAGVTGVTITGNTIGGLLDDGVTPAGNGVDGVAIKSAVGNTVGAGNMISRNGRHGVSMVDARAANLSAGNRILGSTITDNTNHGIYVGGGSFSTIGGTGAGDGNVIQANGQSGIFLGKSLATGAATSYAIQGNFVGTDTNRDVDSTRGNLDGGIVVVDGAAERIEGNTVMNNQVTSGFYDGISLLRGAGSVVGGTTAAQGNLVADNARDGIRVTGGAAAAQFATGHWVTGNTIVDNGDQAVGAGNGVTVTGAYATNITVGQSVTNAGVKGLGNVIRGNAVYGAAVINGAQQVSVQGNSIGDNLGVNALAAIKSFGIYVAPGSNSSTASTAIPITLTAATIRRPAGSQMQVLLQGSLSGVTKGQQYTIDVYANPASTQPGSGATNPSAQAARFLGRITVTAIANGTITWSAKNPLVISANVAVGEFITASVTALRVQPGSTSNLSVGRMAR